MVKHECVQSRAAKESLNFIVLLCLSCEGLLEQSSRQLQYRPFGQGNFPTHYR